MNTINTKTNLIDTAAANGSFNTFSRALEQSGIGVTLRGDGPFTVFAPTDEAFARLPAGQLEKLLKPESKEALVTLLNGHVIRGRKSAADISKWDKAKMLGGQSVPIRLVGNQVSFGAANVTISDIESSNGVIHSIDHVVMAAPAATAPAVTV